MADARISSLSALAHPLKSDNNVNNPSKILYVGAGLHVETLTHFRHTPEFVFIDNCPRGDVANGKYFIGFYCTIFYDRLIKQCKEHGFNLETMEVLDSEYYKTLKIYGDMSVDRYKYRFINPHRMTFINATRDQILRYYISTDLRCNIIPEVISDIETVDALIISGYYPSKEILNHIRNSMLLVCYTRTYYRIRSDTDKSSILYYLHMCTIGEFDKHFTEVLYLDYIKGHMIGRYYSIQELCLDVHIGT